MTGGTKDDKLGKNVNKAVLNAEAGHDEPHHDNLNLQASQILEGCRKADALAAAHMASIRLPASEKTVAKSSVAVPQAKVPAAVY